MLKKRSSLSNAAQVVQIYLHLFRYIFIALLNYSHSSLIFASYFDLFPESSFSPNFDSTET